jgi:hypothetical protein
MLDPGEPEISERGIVAVPWIQLSRSNMKSAENSILVISRFVF